MSFCVSRSHKLIQESEQHLSDLEKILQKDKRYLVLDCMSEERHKLLMAYLEELDRRGPPPPPTALNLLDAPLNDNTHLSDICVTPWAHTTTVHIIDPQKW